LLQQITSLDEG